MNQALGLSAASVPSCLAWIIGYGFSEMLGGFRNLHSDEREGEKTPGIPPRSRSRALLKGPKGAAGLGKQGAPKAQFFAFFCIK